MTDIKRLMELATRLEMAETTIETLKSLNKELHTVPNVQPLQIWLRINNNDINISEVKSTHLMEMLGKMTYEGVELIKREFEAALHPVEQSKDLRNGNR